MTDDPADERPAGLGSSPSEEWIGKIAESEGVSREEVVERLIASYWTLKEMYGLLQQTEEGVDPAGDELPLDVGPSRSDSLSEELSALRQRVGRLEVEAQEADPEGAVDELRSRVDGLSERLSAAEESLAARQDSLGSRMDREFANLEIILEYLVETTDELGDDVAALADRQQSDGRRREARDRLAELKRRAARLGVRTAKCAYCDTTIDVAMLPTPECPRCDREFVDVEPNAGWRWFGSNVLVVASAPLDGSSEARTDEGAERGGPDEEGDESDRFVWGEQRD